MPRPITILQVEDDNDDIELLNDAFRDNGIPFIMQVVKQGDKVMPWLEQCTLLPEVIVMDLNLPKMHGKEILVHLKASEKYRSIPVVILTTSSAQPEITFCLQNGAQEFMTKPATVEGFKNVVKTIEATVRNHRDNP